MKVVCKYCGAENDKDPDQYRVECKECGKTTHYYVRRG